MCLLEEKRKKAKKKQVGEKKEGTGGGEEGTEWVGRPALGRGPAAYTWVWFLLRPPRAPPPNTNRGFLSFGATEADEGRRGGDRMGAGVVHERTHVAYVHMFRREAPCAGDEEKT